MIRREVQHFGLVFARDGHEAGFTFNGHGLKARRTVFQFSIMTQLADRRWPEIVS